MPITSYEQFSKEYNPLPMAAPKPTIRYCSRVLATDDLVWQGYDGEQYTASVHDFWVSSNGDMSNKHSVEQDIFFKTYDITSIHVGAPNSIWTCVKIVPVWYYIVPEDVEVEFSPIEAEVVTAKHGEVLVFGSIEGEPYKMSVDNFYSRYEVDND